MFAQTTAPTMKQLLDGLFSEAENFINPFARYKFFAYSSVILQHWLKIRAAAEREGVFIADNSMGDSTLTSARNTQLVAVIREKTMAGFSREKCLANKLNGAQQVVHNALDALQKCVSNPATLSNVFADYSAQAKKAKNSQDVDVVINVEIGDIKVNAAEFWAVLLSYLETKNIIFADVVFRLQINLSPKIEPWLFVSAVFYTAVELIVHSREEEAQKEAEKKEQEQKQQNRFSAENKPIIADIDRLIAILSAEADTGFFGTLFHSGQKFGRASIKRANKLFLSSVKDCLGEMEDTLTTCSALDDNDERKNALLPGVKIKIKKILSDNPSVGTGYHAKPSRTMVLLEKTMQHYGLIKDSNEFKALVAEVRAAHVTTSLERTMGS